MIVRIGATVLVACSLLGAFSPSEASARPAASASRSCGTGTKMTSHADLRQPLRIVDGPGLIGDRTLWTIPRHAPEYEPSTKSWMLVKQAWFRLEEGPLTVAGRRVDGGAGAFHADIPPVESYPLGLNANIGPGFIPSTLEFSTGGCWKVSARLGRSNVVLIFDIDGSKGAICAQLAADLREVRGRSEPWALDRVDMITADQQARGCQSS